MMLWFFHSCGWTSCSILCVQVVTSTTLHSPEHPYSQLLPPLWGPHILLSYRQHVPKAFQRVLQGCNFWDSDKFEVVFTYQTVSLVELHGFSVSFTPSNNPCILLGTYEYNLWMLLLLYAKTQLVHYLAQNAWHDRCMIPIMLWN